LIYSATLLGGAPLPAWLNFDPTTRIFSGTPIIDNLGTLQVTVIATDPFGASVARSFDINVLSPSGNSVPQKIENIPDYSVGIGQNAAFQVSNGTFVDPDGDLLTYSASLTNSNPLPNWLNFNPRTLMFQGLAPLAPEILPIAVQAQDWQHIPATAEFKLFVEGAPQLAARLSNLLASVGTKFKFVVPENTFQSFGAQNGLTYMATLTTGELLPAWLSFDPATRTFSGTPSYDDTNAFSNRPLPIRLIASNDFGSTSADFIINVQGESTATLSIKIVGGFSSIISALGATYAKRNFVWKKTMKCVYQSPTEHVVIGQEEEFCHTITRLTPEQIASVKLLRDGKPLPGGMLRPDWLNYDNTSGKITLDATAVKEQEGLTTSQWTIQVKNRGGYVNDLLWEEFKIEFVHQLPDPRDASDTVMTPPNQSRQKALRQPLLIAP